ncbi:DeoR/GlpR family DNA-binding transcription regulator [Castellaniella sp. GW247-6E4]|uniref:DeoR/GlpR family DNA-binding transcription regulator n=1 Tax=Castellaniella sp. GW247-6E4 TaxID=3140380 RepID=UPI003315201D
MTSNPRQLRLLSLVRASGSCTLEQLSDALGVSVQTIRRDVKRLAEAGLLLRFHGGARLPGSTIENIAYQQRASLQADAKRRIGEAIAQRVPDHCSLLLNIGTSTEAVAQALTRHTGLRVITNNMNVAYILSGQPGCEVILAGGSVRARDHGIVGEAAAEFMRQFRVDIAVIGISGIEADGTLRDFDFQEVKVSQTIIAQAREVWLAADFTKFNRPAMIQVGRLEQIDRLFTDRPPPPPFPGLLNQARVDCIVANPPAADDTSAPTTDFQGSRA